jgi:subtilisin family serine protease
MVVAGTVQAQPPKAPQLASRWHLTRIKAPQAWELSQGSPGVVIAIVDSGIDPYHPDLASKLVAGVNTFSKLAGTADQFGHGTKIAGVAAARSNHGVGIAGVAGLSPLMPVRVTDRTGGAKPSTIASGIVWAVDHGARVVNLSLEGVVRHAAIRKAAEYAYRHGVLVVAPSGNCGCVDPSPETPFILSVSATDENDRIVPSSSAGAFVDLAAPGVNIPTTALYGLYVGESGTSLSSAIVAGVAALMFSVNPELTPAAATEILQATAVRPEGPGRDARYGHGRVDAYAAVSAAARYRGDAAKDNAGAGRQDRSAAASEPAAAASRIQ